MGVTALVMRAFTESHRHYIEEDGPFMRRPLAFLRDGATPTGVVGGARPYFDTAAALSVLSGTTSAIDPPLVDNARAFLTGAIADGKTMDGYDLLFVLQALEASGLPFDNPAWAAAAALVEDTAVGGNAATTAALRLAGLLSSGVARDDPRAQEALGALRSHYAALLGRTADTAGFYHDIFALTIALRAYGEPTVSGDDLGEHDWRAEVAGRLIDAQAFDGYWANADPARSEDNQLVASSLALLALETIYN